MTLLCLFLTTACYS